MLIIRWLFSSLTISAPHNVIHVSMHSLFLHSKLSCNYTAPAKRSCKQRRSDFVTYWQNIYSHWANSAPSFTWLKVWTKSRFPFRKAGKDPRHLSPVPGAGSAAALGVHGDGDEEQCFTFAQCQDLGGDPKQRFPLLSGQAQLVTLPDWTPGLLVAFLTCSQPSTPPQPSVEPSAPAPVMLQHGWSPAPHSSTFPGHGPCWAGFHPQAHDPLRSPGRCLMPSTPKLTYFCLSLTSQVSITVVLGNHWSPWHRDGWGC